MKRVLALVLIALLLIPAAASAASGQLSYLALVSPKIYHKDSSGTEMVDLTGLTGKVSGRLNQPLVTAQLTRDGADMFNAFASLSGSKVVFSAEGMSSCYAIDLTELGLPAGATAYLPLLASMNLNLKLPKFTGVNIPKIDTTSLLSRYATGSSGGVTTFTIPSDAFVGLMETVIQYANMMGMSDVVRQSGLTEALSELRSGRVGVEVRGQVTDTGAQSSTTFNLFTVENGQVPTEPQAYAALESSQNNLVFTAGPVIGGQNQAMIQATVVSAPAAQRLDVAINAPGTLDFSLALYPNSTLQMLDIKASAQGTSFAGSIGYGDYNGQKMFLAQANMSSDWDERYAFKYTRAVVPAGNGYSGSVDLIVDNNGELFEVITGVQTGSEAQRAGNYAPIANAIDVSRMSYDQQNAAQNELQRILMPLQNYFSTLQPVSVN